jgi:hypothetical protein
MNILILSIILAIILVVAFIIQNLTKRKDAPPGKVPQWYRDQWANNSKSFSQSGLTDTAQPATHIPNNNKSAPFERTPEPVSRKTDDYISPHKKGRSFEEFVITRFSNTDYQLIEWRSDKFIRGWGWPASCQWPDIVMEVKASSSRFAIECKYRSNTNGESLEWARPDQYQNYKDYETRENIPVYIAIGIGGKPHAPKSLFIIRLERLKSNYISLRYLEEFRFPAHVTSLEFG